LVDAILEHGGRGKYGCRANGILSDAKKICAVQTQNDEVEADLFWWTAPITLLAPESGLRFLNTIVYSIGLKYSQYPRYQWCYYGSKRICFSRLSMPQLFNERLVPRGYLLTAEVTCTDICDVWLDPSLLYERITEDLCSTGLLKSENKVLFIDAVRIRETYPIYTLDYRERLKQARESLSNYRNLRLCGRGGSFWYNNMDHSIGQALDLAARERC
jgi:protoporphyrinogen oxidase